MFTEHLTEAFNPTSLAVQWLRPHASNAESTGLIPDRGTRIPHAMGCGQK